MNKKSPIMRVVEETLAYLGVAVFLLGVLVLLGYVKPNYYKHRTPADIRCDLSKGERK